MKDLYFAATHVAALHQRLVAHLEAQGELTPQGWKELTGASRKYTIPRTGTPAGLSLRRSIL